MHNICTPSSCICCCITSRILVSCADRSVAKDRVPSCNYMRCMLKLTSYIDMCC